MSNFSKNLRYYRKERNFTQLELGEKINSGYTLISILESGRIEPDSVTVKSLAEALDVSINKLFDNSH